MDKVIRATLRHLFHEYLKAPSVLYTINTVSDVYKTDAIQISNFLLDKNWIRERWIHQNNLVTCRITVEGIEAINPVYIENKLKQLIGGLAEAGGSRNLMDIFRNKIEEYVIALDIVYQLEKMGLILMRHQKGNITIELTPYGWQFFEKKGKSLFALMAVA